MTSLARRIWKTVAGLFAGVVILLALLVGAFRIVVAQAPDYRQPIADWASGFLGLPVQIDELDARFGLGGPELLFGSATVFSEDGSEALVSASSGILSLDVTELLLRWRLAADVFTLDDLELELSRSEDGHILVFGRGVDDLPRAEGPSLVRELRIRNASVILRDRMEGGRTWTLDDFEAVLGLWRGETRLEGRFSPQTELASSVSFWAAQDAGGGWKSYVSLTGVRLSAVAGVPGIPAGLPRAGDGDLRLWVDTVGAEVTRVSLEADLRDLLISFPEGEAADFRRLGGRLEWDRTSTGWRGRVEGLTVQRPGSQWESARLVVEKSVAAGRQVGDLFLDADFLRLDDLRAFMPLVPDEGLREALGAMRPAGDVAGLTASVTVVDRDARGYEVEVSLEMNGVDIEPYGRLPGVRGLSGRLRSDPKGGRIELDSRELSLQFPDLFREPLEFDSASGLVVWSRGLDGTTVIGDGLTADNRDLGLEAGFRIRLPASGEAGRVDVQATARDVDLASTSHYLPVGIMSPKVVGWLDAAIVSGRVPAVRLNLAGPSRGFPYAGGEGVFEVGFSTRDLVLDYAAGWPAGTGIEADMLFRGPSFSADIREGQLGGVAVDQLRVEIPVLREGMLSIEGTAAGPLEAVHSYIVDSPLRNVTGPALAETRVELGAAGVSVNLLLPLKDLARRDVFVEVDVEDGRVFYGQVPHALDSVDGTLTVDGTTVRAAGMTGVLVGRPVVIDIAPLDETGTRAYVTGTITDAALIEVLKIPLEGYLDGEAEWRGFAHFPAKGSDGRFWIRFDSDLRGMAFTLPHPVAKSAEEARPLGIDFEFPQAGLTEWYAQYGESLSAAARFATDGNGLEFVAGRVTAGGTEARMGSENGLFIDGAVDRLMVLDWLGVRFGDRGETRLQDIFRGIDLMAQEAYFGAEHFPSVSARLGQDDDRWLLTLSGETVEGTVAIPMLMSTGAPLVLDMERLYLDDDERDGAGESLNPRDVPSMDVVAQDFRMEGYQLGRLDAVIRSVPNGFRLDGFTLTGPSHTIEGSGHSLLGFGQDESRVSLEVSTSDLGAAMEYIGFERTVESSSATFTTDLAWTGGLPAEVLRVARGSARLDIESGNLTEVKPGAGRMFGLLSVQALPRRLTLDFRDVFKKGLYFDEFNGDFAIADGEAYTENLVFRGPAADIGIVGTVDLADRVYDQNAIVSADVGSTLPVVGAIAGGPAVGAGLFVLKEIFKDSLRGVVNVQYRITGPWEDPVVERVGADGAGQAGSAREEAPSQDEAAEPAASQEPGRDPQSVEAPSAAQAGVE